MARGAGRLAGRALRGGWGFLVGLAVVVALGGGASIGAAVAAHRTAHAYGEYVEEANVSEVVVNPSLTSPAMDAAIRSFDGVEDVHVDSLLLGSLVFTGPTTVKEAGASTADQWLQVRGELDGRYVDVDRPAVSEGREPSGDHEVFISTDYRPELERALDRHLEVGDTIDVGFFWAGLFDADLDLDQPVDPIGVEALTISGFGALPDEVLPEELFPRQQVVVSADVANRYHCLTDVADARTYQELFTAKFPQDCSAQYDYYALSVPSGADGVRSIRNQFDDAVERLNGTLPTALTDQGIGYYYISQDRADQDAAVRETVRPTVTTLRAFAIVAAIATVTVAGLMVARQTRRDIAAQRSLRALGATRAQIAWWLAAPVLGSVVIGVLGAAAIAFASSPVGPIGSVRRLAPDASPSLPLAVAAPIAAGLLATVALVVAMVVGRSAWRAARDEPYPRRIGRLRQLIGRGRPTVSSGVGAALDPRRAGAGIAAMAGCVVATSAVATALVFGASLADLVDDPDAYGWPWDIAVITGAGYGDTDPAAVEEQLSREDVRDDIAGYAFYSVDPSLLIHERPVSTVFGWADTADTHLPVSRGRMPSKPGEALLGEQSAEDLGLGVGDAVTVDSQEFGELHVTFVGTGVLPSVGAFGADRTGLGTGAFILVDAEPSEAGEASAPSITGIYLRDGADRSEVLARLDAELPTWSALDEPPVTHLEPVRSPVIVDVTELQRAPLALGAALLASLTLGLWLAVTLSVRDRRAELAVLRAIGFGDRDVRRSVRWQGFALLGIGLLVGVPLGIVGGRYAWTFFAERLGVVPTVTVPVTWLIGEVLATLALGWLALALPARSAAGLSPAAELLVP
ncbi:MAG: FtsX-like permease family protein [Acidimicrobiales bacterium]